MICQRFDKLNMNCIQCHTDIHSGQFIERIKELFKNYHTNDSSNPTFFNRNKTRLILDQAHSKLNCSPCNNEKKNGEIRFFNYKFEDSN